MPRCDGSNKPFEVRSAAERQQSGKMIIVSENTLTLTRKPKNGSSSVGRSYEFGYQELDVVVNALYTAAR